MYVCIIKTDVMTITVITITIGRNSAFWIVTDIFIPSTYTSAYIHQVNISNYMSLTYVSVGYSEPILYMHS